ncbi:protein late bloomer [Drosophila nasuta]|uniref:protein late bloomer n=1 Tax=Drosophila nasuta TaxID=42062 RepID=UPI00295EA9F5|nr:protein late bloomer [Drosophila nasuta]
MASTSSLKVLAYALHILCTLLALVLIGFSAYVVISYDLTDKSKFIAACYAFVGGAALILVLWGYLAAWREHVCCTVTFAVLLFLIILVQTLILYVATTKVNDSASEFAHSLEVTWEQELDSPGAMSLYENWFQCCGRGSPQDYVVNERLPPASCFRNHDQENPDNLIHKGCRIEFENYWVHLLHIFNIIGWVLVAVEVLLIFVSCSLCNSIRNVSRRTYF